MLLVWASDRAGGYSLFTKRFNAGFSSAETRLTVSPGRDSTPSLLQSKNGTLWAFWTRQTSSGNNVFYDIYYKTYTNGEWTSDKVLANSNAAELQESVLGADDGTIWAIYSSNKLGDFDLYYRTFGGSWSAETRLTTHDDDDRQAWVMQDLNGTIWAFWARCVTAGPTCQDDVFYKVSYNLGNSWSIETKYTIDPQGIEIFDSEPAAFNARDKKIYLLWTTNITGDGGEFDIYYSTTPIPIHDVGLLSATSYPVSVQKGKKVFVNATVGNLGDYSENVQVNAYFELTTKTLFNSTSLTLPPGRSSRIQLSWNTGGIPSGNYRITLSLVPLPEESPRRQKDNSADAGQVVVEPIVLTGDIDNNGRVDILDAAKLGIKFGMRIGPEDIDHDCDVDIIDAAHLAVAYGSMPGSPNWDPRADVDGNGKVEILDAAQLAVRYGVTVGPEDLDGDCDVDILDAAILALWFGTTS